MASALAMTAAAPAGVDILRLGSLQEIVTSGMRPPCSGFQGMHT